MAGAATAIGLLTADPLMAQAASVAGRPSDPSPRDGRDPAVAALESKWQRQIGLFAADVDSGRSIQHRAGARFPMLSVFKPLLAAHILRSSHQHLDRRVMWSAEDVVEYSPVTAVTVRNGLTVRQLCEAAITRSDNTAANVLLREYGGPSAVTDFARSLGDRKTRLDRREPELNSAIPGDERDTTTPRAIADTYTQLVVGRALPRARRELLTEWLLANQTTTTRFGAGIPQGWGLADKTGAGAYGTRNDVGVMWTLSGRAIIVACLTRSDDPASAGVDEALADAAALACARLG